jgi:chemotaxis protein MotB
MQDLSAENDQLKTDVAERDRQLNDTLVRENDARLTIDELNRELATLRSEREKLGDTGDWISTPTVDMISISNSVLFASGKADLTTTGRARLAQIASDIRSRYADRDIYVFGHTDTQPIRKSKWKDNWELGAQRSLTVVRTLGNQGVSHDRMIVASCGEYRPLTMGATAKNQARNRRVEVCAVRRDIPTMETTAARAYPDG